MMYHSAAVPSVKLTQKRLLEKGNLIYQGELAEYETQLSQYEQAKATIELIKKEGILWNAERSAYLEHLNAQYDKDSPLILYNIDKAELPAGATSLTQLNATHNLDPFSTGLSNYLNSDNILQQQLIDSMLEDVYINGITDMQTFLNHIKDSPIKDLATIVSTISDGR